MLLMPFPMGEFLNMSFQVERLTSKLDRAPRSARACLLCHSRKVRCDIGPSRPKCSNCQRDGQLCKPWLRQRKTKNRASTLGKGVAGGKAAPDNRGENGFAIQGVTLPSAQLPVLNDSETIQVSTGTRRNPDALCHDDAGPIEASPTSQSVSSLTSTYENGYMQRSSYLAPDSLRAEDAPESSHTVVSGLPKLTDSKPDLKSALEYPPRAYRESLFDNFWTYCYPWDPFVEKSDVLGKPLDSVSPILLQAIFLAGSRMSRSTPSLAAISPVELYNRAKTLFWLDHEQDPLMILKAVQLLHWWNPHGPERVSTNTSSFWCRIAVSLAQQMGLHSQQRTVTDEHLRRRMWWSLVVRLLATTLNDLSLLTLTLSRLVTP